MSAWRRTHYIGASPHFRAPLTPSGKQLEAASFRVFQMDQKETIGSGPL